MSPKPYKQVSCDFLDFIEIWATRKTSGKIVFVNDEGARQEIFDFIATWIAQNGEEFLITGSGKKIRLDHIHEIFGLGQEKLFC